MANRFLSGLIARRSFRTTITSPVVAIWALILVGLAVAFIVGVERGPAGVGDSIILFGKPAGGLDILARMTVPLALSMPLWFFIPITAAFLSAGLVRHTTVHYVLTAPISRAAVINSTWLGSAAAYLVVAAGFGVLITVAAWTKGLAMPGAVAMGTIAGVQAAAIHAFVLLCTIASGSAGLGAAAGVAWVAMLGPLLMARVTTSSLGTALAYVLPPVSSTSHYLEAVLGTSSGVPWLLILQACTASVLALAIAGWVYRRKEF